MSCESHFVCVDFETCNPSGTLRKKTQICGLYWILAYFPTGSHSPLSSTKITVLCKSAVKTYGYGKILEPLLNDLTTLEDHGVYVPLLGTYLKGTVHSVVADNLGAHSIAGFSGDYICRFCTAKSCFFVLTVLHLFFLAQELKRSTQTMLK